MQTKSAPETLKLGNGRDRIIAALIASERLLSILKILLDANEVGLQYLIINRVVSSGCLPTGNNTRKNHFLQLLSILT